VVDVGVEISAFPLTWHIVYTTACCYRTSRDTTCMLGNLGWWHCHRSAGSLCAGQL